MPEGIQALLALPIDTLALLAGGYLAYRLAYTGRDTGTVGGVNFAVGQTLVSLINSPSTLIYEGNWQKGDLTELLAALTLQPFKTLADLVASSFIAVGQRAQVAGQGEYEIVPAETYLADGRAVIDLEGILGQAVSPALSLEVAPEEDPRDAALFRSFYGSAGLITVAYRGQRFQLDLAQTGTGHITTLGGVKLTFLEDAVDPASFGTGDGVGNGIADAAFAFLAIKATGRSICLKAGQIYRLRSSLTLDIPIIWQGGIIKLDDGVFLTADIQAPPGVRVFDISALTPVQGQAKNAHYSSWTMNGGLRTQTEAHAAWFGASLDNDDNSPHLQCLMNSGALRKGIDGDYQFTAIFDQGGHVYSSKAVGGRAILSLKVQTKTMDGLDPDPALNYWGNPRLFGVTNGPGPTPTTGLEHIQWSNVGVDLRCEEHWDFIVDDMNRFKNGSGGLNKFLMAANGFSFAEDALAVANTWVRAPEKVTLIDPSSVNCPRNCYVFNRASKVYLKRPFGKNSLIDHLYYGDVNPDSVLEDPEGAGYAESGMFALSGVTVTRPVVSNIEQNPVTGLNTGSVFADRADVEAATIIDNPRIRADLEKLNPDDATRRSVLLSQAKHRLRAVGGSIEHTGDDVPFAIWATAGNEAITYQVPEFDGVHFLGMSSEARLIYASQIDVTNIRWKGGLWRYMEGATSQPGALMLAGEIDRGNIDAVLFDGPMQGTGLKQIVACDKSGTASISAITLGATTTVTATGHGFQDGDVIVITDIVGTTELNGKRHIVSDKTADTFQLRTATTPSAAINSSGYTAYVSGGTINRVGDLRSFQVNGVDWAQGDGSTQWASVTGQFDRVGVEDSWLRCGRPSERNVKWRNSFYGTGISPTEQKIIATLAGNGSISSYAVPHGIGDAPYFVDATALNGFARTASPFHINRGTNTLDVQFSSPVANGQSAVLSISLSLTE
jgi:hypothetical protein